MIRIKSPQDFAAAILFFMIGLVGLVYGSDLTFGTSASMGPGYFPMILSGLTVLVSLIVVVQSLIVEGPPIETIRLRPLVVILATVLVIVFLLDWAGMVTTAVVLTVMASFARPKPKLWEVAILAVSLAAFSVGVFVYGLSLPIPVW